MLYSFYISMLFISQRLISRIQLILKILKFYVRLFDISHIRMIQNHEGKFQLQITFPILLYFQQKKTFLVNFCLCLAIIIDTSKVIKTDSQVFGAQNNNLGFTNSTGAGVTDQMLKIYVKVIAQASNLYKDNVKANLKYIKEKLDNSFASGSQYYFVYIQTNTPVQQNYSIWISLNRTIASLNNVNPINPKWSYLIVRTQAFDNVSELSYLQKGIYGPGMTQGARLAVKNIIESFQGEECKCERQSVMDIRKTLESYFLANQFNVLCDSNGQISALVYAQNGMYGIFQGKCYYTIYKNL